MVKLLIAYNYLKIAIKDKVGIMIMIMMPLMFTFIMGSALEGAFTPKIERFEIAYANEDKGEISRQLDKVLKSSNVSDIFTAVQMKREELQESMNNGKYPAALVVDETFTENVMNGRDARIKIIKSQGKDLQEGILKGVVNNFVEGINFSYAASRVIQENAGSTKNMEMLNAEAVNPGNSESVKEVNLKTGKDISTMQYFASAMLVMFMLFTSALGASNMIKEREECTLMRTMSAPVKEFDVLAGKFIGNVLLALVQGCFVIVFTKLVYNVDWGNSLISLFAITISVVFVAASMSFLLSMVLNSEKAAAGVISVLMLLMSFLGGSFTPLDGSSILTTISYMTINRWAFDGFQKIMAGGTMSSISTNLLVLIAAGCLLMVISVVLFKKRGSLYE